MARRPAAPKSGASGKQPAKKAARGEDKTAAAVEWYKGQQALYEDLAQKVEAVVHEVLDAQHLPWQSITSRAKEVDSYAAKAAKEEYTDPQKQVKDMAGVRVITYVDSQAREIAELVERVFDIDPKESGDTSARLGVDRVGYRATHYIARFSAERCHLPEYRRFEGLEFEIQVRTILQHAWAEINHDRNYKFTGVLPDAIQRRFAVLSGVLELADREFNSIASAIDAYAENVAERAQKGELDIPINTTSLREYMLTKFRHAVTSGLQPYLGGGEAGGSDIVQELADFGISTLAELDSIIPKGYASQVESVASDHLSFAGLARQVMIIHDADRYFEKAWKRNWAWADKRTIAFLRPYGIDLAALADRYGLIVDEDD